MSDDQPIWMTFDLQWNGGSCPVCGKPARGHFFLYDEERKAQEQDDRTPIGEAFRHTDTDDCTRFTKEYRHKHRP